MWRPCEYLEWRGTLPGGERCVFASVWPLKDGPASVKWVELGDEPGEPVIAHETVRMLAFWDWEDGSGCIPCPGRTAHLTAVLPGAGRDAADAGGVPAVRCGTAQ